MNTVEPIRDIGKIWDIADYLGEQNERNRIMFLFGIYVGLRISDILKLQVRDVRDKSHVTIREQKTGKAGSREQGGSGSRKPGRRRLSL